MLISLSLHVVWSQMAEQELSGANLSRAMRDGAPHEPSLSNQHPQMEWDPPPAYIYEPIFTSHFRSINPHWVSFCGPKWCQTTPTVLPATIFNLISKHFQEKNRDIRGAKGVRCFWGRAEELVEKKLCYSQESKGDKLANGSDTHRHIAVVAVLPTLISSGPLTHHSPMHKWL